MNQEVYGAAPVGVVLDRLVKKIPADHVAVIRATLLDMGMGPDDVDPVCRYLRWIAGRMIKGELTDYETGLRYSVGRDGFIIPYLGSVRDWLVTHPSPDLLRRSYRSVALDSFVWHERLARFPSREAVEVVRARVHRVYRWPDGWYMVRLRAHEVEGEGEKMGNCLKQYADEVKAGDLGIYSLRSPDGRPSVTLGQSRSGKIGQVKGRSNAAPVGKYVPYIAEFIVHLQSDPDKWSGEALDVVIRADRGSAGVNFEVDSPVVAYPPFGSGQTDPISGAVRGEATDGIVEVKQRGSVSRSVSPWPFPDQVVIVGRSGSSVDDFGNPIYCTRIMQARRRVRDGMPTWRLLTMFNDDTSGKRVTGPMIRRAEVIAQDLGLPCEAGWGLEEPPETSQVADVLRAAELTPLFSMPVGVKISAGSSVDRLSLFIADRLGMNRGDLPRGGMPRPVPGALDGQDVLYKVIEENRWDGSYRIKAILLLPKSGRRGVARLVRWLHSSDEYLWSYMYAQDPYLE